MKILGREWTRAALEQRIGALSQLGGITRFEYGEGKSRGVVALRVRTAAGLEFSVLPDRGLDIFEASYEGRSLCWHSPAGLSHPAYYDPRGTEWLKTFAGGLLTTCGLTTAGSPSSDQSEELGLHGAASCIPAEHVEWSEKWQGDELTLSISGKLRESSVFGPNLVNHRQIQTTLDGRSIDISDRIVNEGHASSPVMVVYHCNFGFPLLNEHSRIYSRANRIEARNEHAQRYLDTWSQLEPPDANMEERCYYHRMAALPENNARVVLVSDEASHNLAVELSFNAENLPWLVEWKSVLPRHYVLGLEPANCKVDGRRKQRESGMLRFLEPGQSVEHHLRIQVLVGRDEIGPALERCNTAEPVEEIGRSERKAGLQSD
ncbi:MAG: aldose 1-epimerase family protein [Acidobacteriota bacterium]